MQESNATLAIARIAAKFEVDSTIPELDTFTISRIIERVHGFVDASASQIVPGQADAFAGNSYEYDDNLDYPHIKGNLVQAYANNPLIPGATAATAQS